MQGNTEPKIADPRKAEKGIHDDQDNNESTNDVFASSATGKRDPGIYEFSMQRVARLAIHRRDKSFDFQTEIVQGVNIGGWLVLEPWITPSIFQAQNGSVVDEFTLGVMVPNAPQILQQHWETWATFADFQRIANAGLNTVRIPVGYWAYELADNEPYVQGSAPFLEQAVEWSRQLGLKVWIDLHGAPGSQNGFDNSGHRVEKPEWQTGDTFAKTLDVLKQITEKYAVPAYENVVVAIELLNEPLASALPEGTQGLTDFYNAGYKLVRESGSAAVVLHDAFQYGGFWNNFSATQETSNVVVDHHEYQVFANDQVSLQPWQHRQLVCNNAASYAGNSAHWLVVGEWTAAMTDCASALNGYGVGARYDGSYPNSTYIGSCQNVNFIETWSDDFKDNMRGYVEAQLEVFEQHTRGWIFWNFKTEASPEWDLFRLLDAGIFPQPLNDRKFSQICSI